MMSKLTWDAAIEAIASNIQGSKTYQAPQEGRDIPGGQGIVLVCYFHHIGRHRLRLLNACQVGTICKGMPNVM